MNIKQNVLDRCISHEQHMQEVLSDEEYQKDYLLVCLLLLDIRKAN